MIYRHSCKSFEVDFEVVKMTDYSGVCVTKMHCNDFQLLKANQEVRVALNEAIKDSLLKADYY